MILGYLTYTTCWYYLHVFPIEWSTTSWISPACYLDTTILGFLTCTSRWYYFGVSPKQMERYILDFPCVWPGHYDLRISYLRLPLVLLLCFPQTNGALHPGFPLWPGHYMILRHLTCASRWYYICVIPKWMGCYILDFPACDLDTMI